VYVLIKTVLIAGDTAMCQVTRGNLVAQEQ